MDDLILGEALDLLIDNRGKNPPYVAEGIPVISAKAVKRGAILMEEARHISEDTYLRWMPNELQINDVILTSEAPLGECALVTDERPLAIAQRLYGLRGKPGVLDGRYLYYALRTHGVQADLHSRSSGSTVAGIRQPELLKVRIPNPGHAVQLAIAEVLGALDDKIVVNDRIATTADSLRSACYLGAHADAPGEFRQEALSSMAEFINGRPFTKDATGAGRMVVRIAELNSGPGGSTVYNEIEVPEKHLARPGDVLFAWSGSLTVARWFRPEAIVNQHIFKVVPKDDRPMWLVLELLRLKLDEFRAIAADKATTMGHIQRRHLDETVLTPNAAMTQKLDVQIGPLWDRALAAEQESLKIANLRDTLLPQLMSGKLRVRDAEKIVEDTV
ncbi:restriction endonuclease subunit S [Streptomyces pseudovenezuelae]|uniref:restriction endonuclease subunit S n=1 Tax=Streptomyces pseudovenezuelae TaxID=67350 RepID=UPI002E3270D9|nr:restriction endonuclease subunit S [Streptomyces pseudovenezuelae]